MLQDLLVGYPAWAVNLVAVGLAAFAALAGAQAAARAVRLVLRRALHEADAEQLRDQWRRPVRIVRGLAFLLLFAVLLVPILELTGRPTSLALDSERLVNWALGSGVRIVLIATLGWFFLRVVGTVVSRLEYEAGHSVGLDAQERAKRVRTLGNLVEYVSAVLVGGVATLMILRELNLDITPVLTGAGIVGLAVGFGAQSIVKDFFSGFFLILENQVRVGDVAMVNGVGGMVEAVTLRTITLRDMEGTVHIFPNGSINTLANRTKDFSFAVLDIGVAYSEDTDRVVDVLRRVGEDLRNDAAFSASILDALEVLGVDQLAESSVVVKVKMKTLPLKQWEVARELRRRIKREFDREGIEIPFPQVSLWPRRARKAAGSE
jgi:moderate conductance mechanosensitive channel